MKVRTIAQQLLFNTVPVETKDAKGNPIGSGTSFVISHNFPGHGEELFLVTNKHVIKDAWTAYMYFTHLKENQPDIGNPFFLKFDGFEAECYGHPSKEVDIAISPLSWKLDLIGKGGSKAFYTKISTKIIPSREEIEALDAVEPIIFIGYPIGLFDTKNYTPIIRRGITATPVQLNFNDSPAFLIDASVFPGSSGSPVFTYREAHGGDISDLKLLGIVTAVYYQTDIATFELQPAPTQVVPIARIKQMINLGVVFKSFLIKETILDFWKKYGRRIREFSKSTKKGRNK
jgi:hypothetical protein